MKRRQEGFTLIELMIVVAIIAILAAIAIPLYLSYTARAQTSGAVALAAGLKPGVVEYYNTNGSWPSSNFAAGAPAAASVVGKYVASVEIGGPQGGQIMAAFCNNGSSLTVGGGSITCQANKKLDGHSLTLSPSAGAGSIVWNCFVDDANIFALVPTECRHLKSGA